MPIYEYECSACGHQMEAFQKMSDSPLTDCPECHKPKLSKLLSAAGFQLKGTGWYATDFKGSGKADVKKTSTQSSNGSQSSTESGGNSSSSADSKKAE